MAVIFICLFLKVSWVGLGYVIVAFPGRAHLILIYSHDRAAAALVCISALMLCFRAPEAEKSG